MVPKLVVTWSGVSTVWSKIVESASKCSNAAFFEIASTVFFYEMFMCCNVTNGNINIMERPAT